MTIQVVDLSKTATCGTNSCSEAPAFRVYWPGKTIDLCPVCAERARAVARAMGIEVSIVLVPG